MNRVFINLSQRWNTIVIDGHDVEAVCRAFHEASVSQDRPTAILAKTYKGKGVPGMLKKFLNLHVIIYLLLFVKEWQCSKPLLQKEP